MLSQYPNSAKVFIHFDGEIFETSMIWKHLICVLVCDVRRKCVDLLV
jgi:hypothetical protein